MMFAIKTLLGLFFSGLIYLYTLYDLLGFRFRFTGQKAVLSLVLSFCISASTHTVHHSYMGLSGYLWFDNLGIVVLSVLLACITAGFCLLLPRKTVRRLLLGSRRSCGGFTSAVLPSPSKNGIQAKRFPYSSRQVHGYR